MSRNSRKNSSSSALFPMLAVLICAMGALLVLLVVTTHISRSNAVATARAAAIQAQPVRAVVVRPPARLPAVKAVPVETPADPNVAVRQRIEQLERVRNSAAGEVEPRRQELSDAASKLAAAKADLERQITALENMRRLQGEDSKSQGELESTRAQSAITLSDLRRRLRLLKNERATGTSKFAFVAYDGNSGTTRRPIFIECAEKGLRFLPENVTVTADDLEGFSRDFNPLLAGAESLLKYWTVKNRLSTDPGSEPEPYVLFLVRPDGCRAFYAAREMLGNMKSPTGYELIDQEWQIAIPDADPETVEVCKRAVADALTNGARGSETRLANARGNSGGGSSRRGGTGGSGGSGGGGGGGSVFDDAFDEPLARGVGGGGSSGGGSGAGNQASGQNGSRGQGSGITGGSGGSSAQGAVAGSGNGGSFTQGSATGGSGNGGSGGGEGEGSGEPTRGGGGGGGSMAQNASGRRPGTLHQLSPLTGGQKGGPGERDSGDGGEYLVADKRGNVTADLEGDRPDIVHLKQPKANGEKPQEAVNSATGASEESAGARASAGKRDTTAAPQTSMPREDTGMSDAPAGFTSRSNDEKSPAGSKSLRRVWGASNGGASIGYERTVKVEVHGDSIVVGGETVLRVGRGETGKELADGFLAALNEHIQTWGSPPKDFYWVPTLKFVVDPPGQAFYERVRGAAKENGLRSTVEHTNNSSAQSPRQNQRG